MAAKNERARDLAPLDGAEERRLVAVIAMKHRERGGGGVHLGVRGRVER